MISTSLVTRFDAGACNGCQRRDDAPLIEISLKMVSFRICPDCRRELFKSIEKTLCAPTPDLTRKCYRHDQRGVRFSIQPMRAAWTEEDSPCCSQCKTDTSAGDFGVFHKSIDP